MKNRYSRQDAKAQIQLYANVPPELALRVYTSRLIGSEPELVLHGGGNTSAKAKVTTLLGEEMEVIFIKGSGWDLGSIEPAGFPALDLEYLRKLRSLSSLSDEEMVNQFRTHLLDAASPTPSIETLVHAFLPHAFIDHTHADAIVTLTNQQQGEALLREALGTEIAVLPFIMPGFPLAKAVAELYESRPEITGIILMHHGIFTFGDDAKSAYERMIDYVCRAETFIETEIKKHPPKPVAQQITAPDPTVVLPLLRGAMAHHDSSGKERSLTFDLRHDPEIIAALNRQDAETLFTTGVLTPDHVIRTKNYPLFLDFADCRNEEEAKSLIAQCLDEYQDNYHQYFAEQTSAKGVSKTRLDSMPRLLLIRGLGLVGAGLEPKGARIAADIGVHTFKAKIKGEALGIYNELDESSIFDMEYWSLEQAKLGKAAPKPLFGKIALVTGGGGAMALGIARQLLEAGARVFLSDIDQQRLQKVVDKLQQEFSPLMVSSLVLDVTETASVAEAVKQIVLAGGGLDILVPNAGIAHVDRLESLTADDFNRVMAVNCMGVLSVIQTVIPLFRRQNTGGNIIINSSKNVFAPGAAFGAYSASKAAAHQLGKIAALELAEMGVRVNMINADAVFGDNDVSSGLWDVVGPDRMQARNLDPDGLKNYYRERNLLKTEVLAEHVGNGVVFFAANQTPTTGATLPVDGGIPEAFPR